ncbi:hypothetical protein BDV96DRAFT_489327 [Lophiotrema nucula]|uniref:Cupredoxin n=1 Tax=Lophiotrema nucula TaxID=690887 RepID=A0A6A5ZGT1_9PLEO|nr:hypothetical protein BDV96DRAFT_489327 [Lophiotrema nucula]
MKYFAALPLVAGLAAAQSTYVMSAAAVASPAAEGAQTHTVTVGGLKPVSTGMAPFLGYTPEAITAAIGDTVKFVFMQKNHTATQSTFAAPCNAMANGMDSGFKPNPMGMTGAEFEWTMTVNTLDPLWFYCKQKNGTHCGKGMVMSINAATTGDKTHADFKQLAISKNGTDLTSAAIQSVGATAAAAASTVTVLAGDGTGSTATASGAAATASIAQGQGLTGDGQACSCSCLCGVNSFPAAAAQNAFGGFPAMFPS